MENNGKTFSIVGLVLGIVSACIAWWGLVLSIVALACGVVGIIFAVKGKKASQAAGQPTGLATAGLVLSIIGTALAGIGFVACGLCTLCAKAAGSALEEAAKDGTLSSALESAFK